MKLTASWVISLVLVLMTSISCKRETIFTINPELAASIGGTHEVIKYKNVSLGDSCLIYGKFYNVQGEQDMQGAIININGKPYDGYGYKNLGNIGTYKIKLKPGKKILGLAWGYKHHPVLLKLAKDSVNLNFWLTEDDRLLHEVIKKEEEKATK